MADLSSKLAAKINNRVSASVLNRQLGIENLKRHSFENVTTGKTLGRSTVLSGSVEDPRLNSGKPTLIPFLYDGKIVDGAEAVARALKSKRVWPSFDTNEEATEVSKRVSHGLRPR